MSNEEIKEVKEIEEQKTECNCAFCKSVKKILTIAVGTFIGFYCAMSLFFALHRPPMIMHHHGHFYKKHMPRFEQNFDHKKFSGEHAKFRGERPFKPGELPVKEVNN